MQTPTNKRIFRIILGLALLLPPAASIGCASKGATGHGGKSADIFTLPTWKSDSAPGKPKKDPRTPVTMGEFMMLERNDVL